MTEVTVHAAAQKWAQGRAARREVAPKTLLNYQQSFDSFYQAVDPDTPIGGVSTDDIERWLASARTKRGNPYQPGSLNTLASTIRTFFAWALERQLVERDPTVAVARARTPRRLPRRLPRHVVEECLAVADQRARTIFLVALHTGMRRSELADLRVEDWDRRLGEIRVVGKGDKQRSVPVVEELASALNAWTSTQQITTGAMWPSPMRPNVGLTPTWIGQIIHRTGRAAGHHVRPHDLRHTCASDLIEAGVDVGVVRKLLGHVSLATTSVYVDASIAHMRVVIEQRSYRYMSGDAYRPGISPQLWRPAA